MTRRSLLVFGALAALGAGPACGDAPPGDVAGPVRAPAATTLLVRHEEAETVSVLDTARREVVGTLALGARVGPVVLSADAQQAFVSLPDAVAVVDVPARRTIRTLAVPGRHTGLVHAGDVLYVVDNPDNRGRISALDLDTGVVTAVQVVDDLAGAPAIAADGRRVFVPHNFYSGRVTALDLPRLRVRRVMTFEDGVTRLGLGSGPEPARLYVPNGNTFAGRLTVVDTSTSDTVVEIDVAAEPTDVAVHPDGTRAYVPLFREHAIGVIDLGNHTLERTIPVHDYPFRLALSADGTSLFVTHNGWDALSVVDTRTLSVGTVAIPSPADFIAGPPLFVVP